MDEKKRTKTTKLYRGISKKYDPGHEPIGLIAFAKNRKLAARYAGMFPTSQVIVGKVDDLRCVAASGEWNDGLPDETKIARELRSAGADALWWSENGSHTLLVLPEAVAKMDIRILPLHPLRYR